VLPVERVPVDHEKLAHAPVGAKAVDRVDADVHDRQNDVVLGGQRDELLALLLALAGEAVLLQEEDGRERRDLLVAQQRLQQRHADPRAKIDEVDELEGRGAAAAVGLHEVGHAARHDEVDLGDRRGHALRVRGLYQLGEAVNGDAVPRRIGDADLSLLVWCGEEGRFGG
jgi:hypothetical protein